MALTYESNDKMKSLYPVMDEYSGWYGRVIRDTFYPELHTDDKYLGVPEAFRIWMDDVAQNELLDKVSLDHVMKLHSDLHAFANDLIQMAFESEKKPPVDMLDSFTDLYDAFIVKLRRLERDSIQSGSSLDVVTGLRNAQAMKVDLEREMARRARRGKPFCLVLARIDDHSAIKNSMSEEEYQQMLERVSEQIRKGVRTFDDAYRASESDFVLSLKNSDITGASASVVRLRRLLEEEQIIINNEGNNELLTMSYCLSDPVPGDEIEKLMDNMKNDLDNSADGKDVMLEFFEASPLSRYIDSIGDSA
jgi:diguanylate cyclase (GGDEF)-like protein